MYIYPSCQSNNAQSTSLLGLFSFHKSFLLKCNQALTSEIFVLFAVFCLPCVLAHTFAGKKTKENLCQIRLGLVLRFIKRKKLRESNLQFVFRFSLSVRFASFEFGDGL